MSATGKTQVFTCTACDAFTSTMTEAVMLHQAQCEKMPQEKREYRLAVLHALYPAEFVDEGLRLVAEMLANQQE